MSHRHQRGWLKKEKRAQSETWVLFFRTSRPSDGKRVENKIPIGLVRHLPDASSARGVELRSPPPLANSTPLSVLALPRVGEPDTGSVMKKLWSLISPLLTAELLPE